MDENTPHIYRIGGMDCANCAREVEAGVARLPGVQAAEVDFATCTLRLTGEVPFETLQARVAALGKTITPALAEAAPAETSAARGGLPGFWDYLNARHETRLALVGGGGVLLTALLTLLAGLPEEAAAWLYTLSMALTLYPIARSGLNALRINRTFNINLLMTIAAVGAVLTGEHLEAATVIFLFAVGEALEGYTTDRARASIQALLQLRPAQALRLTDKGEEIVPVEALRVGDTLLVKPGERVPMDGVVLAGSSGVDQAPITGESLPVHKAAGATLYAGSINGDGALTMRVTHRAADNTLSRIVRMVAEAQRHRAPSQRLVDQFAAWYTPAIVVLALGVAVVPPLLVGAPFYDTADGHGWLYRALAMLVIACPCALVISTPVTVISAITAAARRGVLIKGGAHLETLARVRAVAFDKTGTLTRGQPVVTAWRAVECETGADCARCDDVLALAAAVERRAAHPLAAAVVNAAEARALAAAYPTAEAIETLAGRGVRGQVAGHAVTLGSHSLFDEHFPHTEVLCGLIADAEADGQTTMLVADDGRVRGFIALADTPRPESRAVIVELRGLGLDTIMLTGDNPAAARAVGQAVGLDAVRAGLLPQDKVTAVGTLADEYGSVAMVGDGINDTPALAAASVGVAMGGAGSPQALETADIALLADDLTQLPAAVRLARFARRLIAQNVVLSLGIKLVFLTLALFGFTSLWAAVLADMGTSLLVTLNGMRPLRQQPR